MLLDSKGGLIKAKRSALTPILELPFNGANGSTTFTDVAKGKTISRQNTIISTAQSVSGGSSAFFDGVSWLTTPDNVDFNFGTGNFVISLDCRPTTNNTNRALISKSNDGLGERYILFAGANNRFIFSRVDAAGNILVSLQSISATSNTWINVKVSRVNNLFSLAVNNVVEATATSSASIFGSGLLSIGYVGSFTGWYFTGYMDNLRIEKT